ncbi:MAG: hypothetical protein JNM93_11110 [Bacteriovoracaceae bacterium]|nr:hypothetical protein [Bacteriovoracaceae bacterium]
MARNRNFKKIYNYDCTITGQSFKVTAEAKNPGELTTVNAYYQLNPEKDDRPLVIKKQLGIEAGPAKKDS